MKTIRSALLAAAVLVSVPTMAAALPEAQPDGQLDGGERGGRPVGPGRFERRPDATPEQSRPQFQAQQGQRQDFGGRSDQGQAPASAQFDNQRPQGPGRFNRPDNQPGGGGDRRPDRQQFDNRSSDNRAPGFGGRFNEGNRVGGPGNRPDPNQNYRGDDRRFDGNNRFPGDNRRFDDNNRYRGSDNRFDNNNRSFGDNRFQRDWRNDRRYDWRGYRNNNRQLYRAPRYAPPRGYGFGYRPFARGYQLQPFFYGQNYWINDPWQYRLPPAYGSYRWVRYYNDVLLVDIYNGTVVDVIENFFW